MPAKELTPVNRIAALGTASLLDSAAIKASVSAKPQAVVTPARPNEPNTSNERRGRLAKWLAAVPFRMYSSPLLTVSYSAAQLLARQPSSVVDSAVRQVLRSSTFVSLNK